MNAGPARYDSREAPWSAGDGSAEPGAYRPGYELLAEQILRLIGELALAPGDRMPTEQNLAARLGASRTTVREAVKILSAIGRIRAQKGRGLYVADGRACSGRAFSSRCVADIGGIIEFMGIVTGPFGGVMGSPPPWRWSIPSSRTTSAPPCEPRPVTGYGRYGSAATGCGSMGLSDSGCRARSGCADTKKSRSGTRISSSTRSRTRSRSPSSCDGMPNR